MRKPLQAPLKTIIKNSGLKVRHKDLNQLDKQFPEIGVNINYSLWQNFTRVYKKTGKKFMFVFDNWDYILKSDRISKEDKGEYLEFIAELFTDSDYVLVNTLIASFD